MQSTKRIDIMAISNSTGKDKEFYDRGKKMFDRIQPITRNVPQIPQERYSKRPWVDLTDKDLDYLCNLAYTGDEEFALAVQARIKEKNHAK